MLRSADPTVDHDASTFDHRSISSTALYAGGNDLLHECLPIQKDKESNTVESVKRLTEDSDSLVGQTKQGKGSLLVLVVARCG